MLDETVISVMDWLNPHLRNYYIECIDWVEEYDNSNSIGNSTKRKRAGR